MSIKHIYHVKPGTAFFVLIVLSFFVFSCDGSNNKQEEKETEQVGELNKTKLNTYRIEYNTLTKIEGVEIRGKVLQWIDLKNKRFRVEVEDGTGITLNKHVRKSLLLGDNKWTCVIDLSTNTGLKFDSDTYYDNPLQRIKEFDEVNFEKNLKRENGKITGVEILLGKKCTIVELSVNQEHQFVAMKAWYYNGIPLKMITQFNAMVATSFEENIEIPEENLKIPNNITFMEISDM